MSSLSPVQISNVTNLGRQISGPLDWNKGQIWPFISETLVNLERKKKHWPEADLAQWGRRLPDLFSLPPNLLPPHEREKEKKERETSGGKRKENLCA